MFTGNWGKYAAFAAIGLVVFLCLIFCFWPQTEQSYTVRNYDVSNCGIADNLKEGSKGKGDSPTKKPESKHLINGQEIIVTLHVESDAQNATKKSQDCKAEQHEISDLGAQWMAAIAAKNNVAVAKSQLVWTIIGSALLLATIGLTVIATNAAREATQVAALQARPWVKLSDTQHAFIRLEGNGSLKAEIQIPAKCINLGQTPAMNLRVSVEFFKWSDLNSRRTAYKRFENDRRRIGFTVFPDIPTDANVLQNFDIKWLSKESMEDLGVIVAISYRGAGSQKIHITPHVGKAFFVPSQWEHKPNGELTQRTIPAPMGIAVEPIEEIQAN
jgi:hypothetical protein